MENKVFHEFWRLLPEQKKEHRLRQSYSIVRKIAEEQLSRIKKLKKSNIPKGGVQFWAFTIVESFWQDADFVFRLGRRQDKYHGAPIVRIILEKLVKFGYVARQPLIEQERITVKELLKISKRFYNADINSGGDGSKWKLYYDEMNQDFKFPAIDAVKEGTLNPFPESREIMFNKSGITDPDGWYSQYRWLSEMAHGGLFYQCFRTVEKPREYRRVFMLLLKICLIMLEWTDVYLGFDMRQEVESVIKKTKEIVRRA